VRLLPDHSVSAIKRGLDAGANVVLATAVDSGAQARAILRAGLFAPEGQRSIAVGAIAASDQGFLAMEYFRGDDLHLPDRDARGIDALPGLLDLPGIDGVFIGPNDLSALGVFRDFEAPVFRQSSARR